uniref:Uncharacterized protein n=1 Tax=viral metagenome TaxID=1070528 RepID=A0A6C0E5T6_9ZZZZ
MTCLPTLETTTEQPSETLSETAKLWIDVGNIMNTWMASGNMKYMF